MTLTVNPTCYYDFGDEESVIKGEITCTAEVHDTVAALQAKGAKCTDVISGPLNSYATRLQNGNLVLQFQYSLMATCEVPDQIVPTESEADTGGQ